MKTELRLVPHSILPDTQVVEIWHGNQFIGTIAGDDGPGVRIISKFPLAYAGMKPICRALAAVIHEKTASSETANLVNEAMHALPNAARAGQVPNCLAIAIQTHL